ncbi:Transposase DDE domain protein [Psychrobacter pasteurii]|uniref:Transposase DDE domain protein n=1 Tax=Psychrobacter pasteurii TaxID=1945520 RepID=A0A1R4EIX1_9GAMM|nr:ISAs1 family transposase [Psychrobacter pasteurii]SJM38475.1 Transposase DDE domain protein [Psychrobacter pasteurii]
MLQFFGLVFREYYSKFLQGGFKDTDSIHLVTAFASETKLVLAQTQVNSKDNEITTLPRLLDMINLKGSVVTGDAMYCQKDVCKQLVKAKADYILSLKRNHELLYDDVKLWLDTQFDSGNLPINETVDKDHGRIEVRRLSYAEETVEVNLVN